MLVSKVQGLKDMKVRRSLNCRVGKVRFGLVGRTVVLIEGIIVGGNPNIGLVTEAEANCCRASFWTGGRLYKFIREKDPPLDLNWPLELATTPLRGGS